MTAWRSKRIHRPASPPPPRRPAKRRARSGGAGHPGYAARQLGFSLIELSIVLVVVALLGSGLMLSLSAQREFNRHQEFERQSELIRDSLLGFALSQGRLPCPADPAQPDGAPAAGLEDCSRQHGILPWATLAMPPGDPWGRRFTYYASERFSGPPATPGGAACTLDTVGNANVFDGNGKAVASALPLIVVSHGANGLGAWLGDGTRLAGAAGGEAENADADLSFVAAPPGTADNDDRLLWISAEQLKARLASAGRLP